ncbi:uncharacterized protein LOC120014225 [Tripterygium wilfordii]|uniref:uncharacterized protein LOC120014225 n=1 Tax=Tripterygium wilfordii TaxID=458696 RepID=UPI0018F809E1|nr:uncharacterized protein LOC120014225 [Tripterygium wilfordii]
MPIHRLHHHPQVGMRFVALQVRRPSGRPQGILNIGLALLDSSRQSMPLNSQLDASAVNYRHLMGQDDPHHLHQHGTQNNTSQTSNNQNNAHQNLLWSLISKPELRRIKSDTSSMMASSLIVTTPAKTIANKGKASSMVSGLKPELDKKQRKNKKGNSKSSSVINATDGGKKDKMGKPDLVVKALEPGPNVNGLNPTHPIQKVSSGKPIPKCYTTQCTQHYNTIITKSAVAMKRKWDIYRYMASIFTGYSRL